MSVDGTSAAAALLLKRLFDALLPPFCSFPFFFLGFANATFWTVLCLATFQAR